MLPQVSFQPFGLFVDPFSWRAAGPNAAHRPARSAFGFAHAIFGLGKNGEKRIHFGQYFALVEGWVRFALPGDETDPILYYVAFFYRSGNLDLKDVKAREPDFPSSYLRGGQNTQI